MLQQRPGNEPAKTKLGYTTFFCSNCRCTFAARNLAILRVLFETGMSASEVCGLRLVDVDREQGTLRIRGTGSKVRVLTLGHEGQRHLLAYLDGYRLTEGARFERGGGSLEHLFLSETGRPLTKSALGLLFDRLRKRGGRMSAPLCCARALRCGICKQEVILMHCGMCLVKRTSPRSHALCRFIKVGHELALRRQVSS